MVREMEPFNRVTNRVAQRFRVERPAAEAARGIAVKVVLVARSLGLSDHMSLQRRISRGAPHLLRQQAPAGLGEDLRTRDDILVGRVLPPMMADAADRGHEQHARRHEGGEHLSVMSGAARHAQ